MSFTASYVAAANVAGESFGDVSVSYTNDGLESRDVALTSSQVDQACDLTVTRADITFIYIVCANNATVEINDGAGIGGTITLKAGIPWLWYTDRADMTLSDVITVAEITSLHLTNSEASATTLKIRILFDSSP